MAIAAVITWRRRDAIRYWRIELLPVEAGPTAATG